MRIVGMHIDSYQFGRIVIDGVGYGSDLIILGDGVQENWRRVRGQRCGGFASYLLACISY